MWAIDLTHTSHTRAQTGIQQVCRSLYTHLQATTRMQPIVYDRYAGSWRALDNREQSLLAGHAQKPVSRRSSRWTPYQKVRGCMLRAMSAVAPPLQVEGILIPEIMGHRRTRILFKNPFSSGLKKVGIFYDAIPSKFPQWCSKEMVTHFPEYLRCLSKLDHVACISQTSMHDLLEQWQILGVTPATTSVLPLGIPRCPTRQSKSTGNDPPVVLHIGTLEKRKNHRALIEAAELLWSKGIRFKLILAGMANAKAANETLELCRMLRRKDRPIELAGALGNASLDALLQSSDLLAYPSLYEGFGLPVLEALAYGKPVLTTDCGALSEHVHGGGCRICDGTVEGIREGLEDLVLDASLRERLAGEAANRSIPTMAQTAASLFGILEDVSTAKASSN